MTLTAGAKLGRYEIRSQLGAGGMGEVYLAFDTELDRTVAIKILPETLVSDPKRLQRFIQEAKAASALNHPHILTIYEVGTSGNSPFIVTEFIDGKTLRRLILNGSLSLNEILDVAIQTAGALVDAHAAGIIHRDIKPENIMVRRDGYIKVVDFGLAKLTEPSIIDNEAATRAMVNTHEGMVVGTANYMSPEQAKGTKVDERTDLWSLGAVLYEMISGHPPFEGKTPTEIISLILQKEPAPLTRYTHEVPAELERIVSKALTKNREERYQTARDLLIDLRNLKRKLEVDAEIDRTVAPELRSGPAMTSGQATVATVSGGAAATAPAGAFPASSSAEYIVSGIKQHKLAATIAVLLLVIGGISLGLYLRARNADVAIDSIAVLPFQNRSTEADTEYLSDGLAESLIYRLSQLPNLKVSPTSSVFHYKGREIDPVKVGQELGVNAVLSGRMVQRGDNLTISAELIDVRYNKLLWGEQYDRKMSELLQTQREIAREIVDKLKLKVSGEEKGLAKHYTESNEAYQLYLKGRFYWNKRNADALRKSVEYFNQAIEKDPNFALAYAGLADAYCVFPTYSAASPRESYPQAKAAAKKAMEIDDTLAEPHASLAWVLFLFDWNFAESDREFQRAIQLNPNYPTAHHWYGDANLRVTGRFDEAIAQEKRAQELDPLSLIINADLGTTYIYARRYDKAIEQLRKTIEMDPSFYYARWRLGTAYELKGSLHEAMTEYQNARALNDDPTVLALMGRAYAASGKRDEASRTLDQLKEIAKHRYVPAYAFALLYAGLGEKDQAFQWLERGYQDRAFDMPYLKVDPLIDSLRSDPRFEDLLRRVGLPQ